MRYLVATDGSEESTRAVRYAVEQAVALDASVELVHVLTPEVRMVDGELVLPGGDRSIEVGNRALERAERVAAEIAEDRGHGLTVDTELLTGRPADAICARARETGADAIYLGHRGLAQEREEVVGSVAKRVVHRAEVPVTVCK